MREKGRNKLYHLLSDIIHFKKYEEQNKKEIKNTFKIIQPRTVSAESPTDLKGKDRLIKNKKRISNLIMTEWLDRLNIMNLN